MAPAVEPSALSSVTVFELLLVTHMWVPSNAIPTGVSPTGKVPAVEPSALSSVTVFDLLLVTHMWVPSNAIPAGVSPTGKVPGLVGS